MGLPTSSRSAISWLFISLMVAAAVLLVLLFSALTLQLLAANPFTLVAFLAQLVVTEVFAIDWIYPAFPRLHQVLSTLQFTVRASQIDLTQVG